ncbi:hypothetical protein GCM10011367_15230 [Marinicauda pacifica]|nr:amidohydrolase family protein [Marinicauda pacifica]GGE41552.1 hypothetical protein GCM10011367_15230 [Marinicauda pacifica]
MVLVRCLQGAALGALSLAALVMVSSGGAQAQPSGEDRYVILSGGGEEAGHLIARRDGDRVEIDYEVDSNGRGAENTQTLVLGDDFIPRRWEIEGSSLFGDPVEESMRLSDGVLTWSSQPDSGEVRVDSPRLYIAADDSPWSQGLYARALLNNGLSEAPVVPGGTLRIETVQPYALEGEPSAAIYRLTGLSSGGSYILLGEDYRLIASFSSGSVTILDAYRGEAPALRDLHSDLEAARFRELQADLAHGFDAPVQIRNVRIFDPVSLQLGPLSVVTVSGRDIATIETADTAVLRDDVHVIDGEGGTLVPGLHDMHAHVGMSDALNYIGTGVTSVRDMGNSPDRLEDLIGLIESGELAGPRIVRAGMLEGRSPYSVHTGITADTLDEALEAVRWYAAHGYWQIKIYNSLHPEWVEPVAAEASRLGLGVTGHIPAFVTPDEAIEAGYDEIAHVNQLMLGWLLEPDEDTRTPIRLTGMQRAAALELDTAPVRHTVELMREHDVALDTTGVTLELLMLSRSGEYPETAMAYVEHMPIGYRRNRKRAFVTVETEEQDAAYRAGFQRILDTFALLHENGIQLLPGTDSGTGFPVHRELALYVEAGLSPGEALALGTLRAEEYLGRDQWLGSIERGKRADFFLIPGDPTQDITEIGRIRLVMKDGVAYLPSEIHTRLGIEPFAEPVAIRPPQAHSEG